MLIIPVENTPDWRRPPLVTLLLVLANVWVHLAVAGPDTWLRFGLVPAESVWWSYLSSMFLHGGLDHLIGNMAFLFLFGFALERVLGPLGYGAVYLLGGLAGGVLHVLVNAESQIPTIVCRCGWQRSCTAGCTATPASPTGLTSAASLGAPRWAGR